MRQIEADEGLRPDRPNQRASGERSARAVEDERRLERIEQVHAANYCAYGYRRTWKALLRAGADVGRDRVKRLMRTHAIQGAKRRAKPWRTTRPDPAARRRPDLVQRDLAPFTTLVRAVCNNTVRLALERARAVYRVRHVGNPRPSCTRRALCSG